MKDFYKTIAEKLASGQDAVLCSIIASSGSTPRGEGAKMVLFSDDAVKGTVGGGAVEYQSILLAKEALKTKAAFRKGFELKPNQTADIGMICGGSVVVYFQFFSHEDKKAKDLFDYIVKMFEDDMDAWLIMQISEGGVRQMGVYRKDTGLSFLQDISLDIIKPMLKSKGVIKRTEQSQALHTKTESTDDIRSTEAAAENSLLYVEPLIQSGIVYIFGGGHVSQELVPVITHVGFRVAVYEDREDFAAKELFPTAYRLITAPFTELTEHIKIRENDYVVIMTRGHQADYDVLSHVIRTQANYIGVIGSRKKKEATFKRLVEEGIPEADLNRIHTPIGLPIKGETPAEIAISIAGELILNRAQRNETTFHIVISGDTGAGKSTLIRKLLQCNRKSLSGFITKKQPPDAGGMCKVYMNPINQEHHYSTDNLIGECPYPNPQNSIKYPEVFDRYGVGLVKCKADGLLVMDELGFMENEALRFQKAVLDALDNREISVLAAVKSRDTQFLHRIKNHPNVRHYELTIENRENVFSEILHKYFT